jgi:hypothetical protein
MSAKLITDKPARLSALIALSLVLLFSQLAAAKHELAHQQHDHEQLCDAFLAFDHNPVNLAHTTLIVPALYAESPGALTSPPTLSKPHTSQLIRGPPAH